MDKAGGWFITQLQFVWKWCAWVTSSQNYNKEKKSCDDASIREIMWPAWDSFYVWSMHLHNEKESSMHILSSSAFPSGAGAMWQTGRQLEKPLQVARTNQRHLDQHVLRQMYVLCMFRLAAKKNFRILPPFLVMDGTNVWTAFITNWKFWSYGGQIVLMEIFVPNYCFHLQKEEHLGSSWVTNASW